MWSQRDCGLPSVALFLKEGETIFIIQIFDVIYLRHSQQVSLLSWSYTYIAVIYHGACVSKEYCTFLNELALWSCLLRGSQEVISYTMYLTLPLPTHLVLWFPMEFFHEKPHTSYSYSYLDLQGHQGINCGYINSCHINTNLVDGLLYVNHFIIGKTSE